ncbi:MAG: ATP-dependent DNA helicase RecG [Candidatus Aegiribacteria sp.]|nr:ATP-dependent DNA helicase RecG [Candidatus Aegiribacteria sp.]
MLKTDVRYLKGIGPARGRQLSRLGIETIFDLLLHVPRGYHDRRIITPIRSLVPGEEINVSGTVVSSGYLRSRNGKTRLESIIRDNTGELKLTFFHFRYIADRLKPGTRIIASGRIDYFGGISIVHPELIFLDEERSDTRLVLPLYPLTAGITQGIIRKLIETVLDEYVSEVPEVLPPDVLNSMGFQNRSEVIRKVHFPDDPEEGSRARRTLALEEFFVYQSLLSYVRNRATKRTGMKIIPPEGTLAEFVCGLPYSLTGAQQKVLEAIAADLRRDVPMRRLLQGDVGSGKTVVAAAACILCCRSGYQAVMVAPTEVLASQHYRTVSGMLESAGIRCGLLTGGIKASDRRNLLESLLDGSLGVLIGTHAVFEERVVIPEMGLCIIDEQHKFGVEQREKLLSKREPSPHFMLMSATPIPRTLAMTIYGDLDISVLDEMPPGRGSTTTRVMNRDSRTKVYEFLLDRLGSGERAYIIYPLREASEELDLKDAATSFEILKRGPLGKFGVGLLTGAMKPEEKLEVTGKFVSGEISILVSTTVVEVGLDVPEATVMVVTHAERFGLSQLHQLRGRIGRGGNNSWCFLMKGEECGAEGARRLAILNSTDDGFRIAERDLQLRGPGEVAGTRQHGVPAFRIASLIDDLDLLEKAADMAARSDLWKSLTDEYKLRFRGLDILEL